MLSALAQLETKSEKLTHLKRSLEKLEYEAVVVGDGLVDIEGDMADMTLSHEDEEVIRQVKSRTEFHKRDIESRLKLRQKQLAQREKNYVRWGFIHA